MPEVFKVRRQRAVDSIVHILVHVALRVQRLVFAYPVEDDHRVHDGITDNGEDGGYEMLVNFEAEWKYAIEHRKNSDNNKCIMEQRNHASQAPLPFLESECNVNKDDQKRKEYGKESLLQQAVCNGRLNFLRLKSSRAILPQHAT